MSSQSSNPLIATRPQHQPLRVAVSILLLLAIILLLVILDHWIFHDPGLPTPAEGSSLEDDQVQTARLHEAYQQWTYLERQRSFGWQARSTKVIFWISVLVALSGVGFSFWQFVAATKEAERALEEHQLEIRTELISLAFKSRSIAALVLFMSVAYLLVYALLIYPISDAGTTPGGTLVPIMEPRELPIPSSATGSTLPNEIIEDAENEPIE
jgi:Trk-type K+ transport system membrane component